MGGWFKSKQNTNDVGELPQAVYQDQSAPLPDALPTVRYCGGCARNVVTVPEVWCDSCKRLNETAYAIAAIFKRR
jgi:hypothetical protein